MELKGEAGVMSGCDEGCPPTHRARGTAAQGLVHPSAVLGLVVRLQSGQIHSACWTGNTHDAAAIGGQWIRSDTGRSAAMRCEGIRRDEADAQHTSANHNHTIRSDTATHNKHTRGGERQSARVRARD